MEAERSGADIASGAVCKEFLTPSVVRKRLFVVDLAAAGCQVHNKHMSHPEFLRNASTIEKALKSEVFPNLGGGNSQEPGECHPKDD